MLDCRQLSCVSRTITVQKLNEPCGAGIAASNDKMLQSRLVAYADAQRYRLGVNYLQLPINQPHNRYHNNHNEGNIQSHGQE